MVASGSNHAFSGAGGIAPDTYGLFTNNSGGAIDPVIGTYTAGTGIEGSVTDTVRVTDADGNCGCGWDQSDPKDIGKAPGSKAGISPTHWMKSRYARGGMNCRWRTGASGPP